MMWFLFFFILLVAKLLLRTDAIPYRPIFIYTRLHATSYIYDLHVDSPILQTEEKRQGKLLNTNYTKVDIDDNMVKALDIPRETK